MVAMQRPEGATIVYPHAKRMRSMRPTLLYVEDHDDLRMVTAMLLSRLGYEVVEAPDGAEALNLLDGGVRADLLLTDLIMPKMSGVKLAVEVRRRWPSLKILFVTAYPYDLRLSGETVVDKPFTMEQLRAAITRALET